VKDRNAFLLDEGMKKRSKKEKIDEEKIRHEAMKEYAAAVNEHLKDRAVCMLKGAFISAESFTK
jgi:hypoxanthine-guanine phosphoribosyltransferase